MIASQLLLLLLLLLLLPLILLLLVVVVAPDRLSLLFVPLVVGALAHGRLQVAKERVSAPDAALVDVVFLRIEAVHRHARLTRTTE